MELTDADKVWNRACIDSGGADPLEGDRALADMLFFDGMAQNGGLGHAFDVLSEEELAAAINGFRFFGFREIAHLLERAAPLSEPEQEQLSGEYYDLESDAKTFEAFEILFRTRPELFAALDAPSHQ